MDLLSLICSQPTVARSDHYTSCVNATLPVQSLSWRLHLVGRPAEELWPWPSHRVPILLSRKCSIASRDVRLVPLGDIRPGSPAHPCEPARVRLAYIFTTSAAGGGAARATNSTPNSLSARQTTRHWRPTLPSSVMSRSNLSGIWVCAR